LISLFDYVNMNLVFRMAKFKLENKLASGNKSYLSMKFFDDSNLAKFNSTLPIFTFKTKTMVCCVSYNIW